MAITTSQAIEVGRAVRDSVRDSIVEELHQSLARFLQRELDRFRYEIRDELRRHVDQSSAVYESRLRKTVERVHHQLDVVLTQLARQPVPTVVLPESAIRIDMVPSTVNVHPPEINVHPPEVNVHPPEINVHPPEVTVQSPHVTVPEGAIAVTVEAKPAKVTVNVPPAVRQTTTKEVIYDEMTGRPKTIIETTGE